MEEEVDEVVGPKGRHEPGADRGAARARGRRGDARRPPCGGASGRGCGARTASAEVALATYEHFADRDPLTRVVLERMLAGVSTRRYARMQEPVGEEVEDRARSTTKSSVSRAFVERTREALGELMARRLDDVRLAVMMLDGIDLKGRTNDRRARDHHRRREDPARAVGRLDRERDRRDRAAVRSRRARPRPEQGMLFVIDGAKALRKAIRAVFGEVADPALHPPQRAKRARAPARTRPARRQAAAAPGLGRDRPRPRALEQLQTLAGELDRTHPGAAGSLREGMEETLTLTRLGIKGPLKRTLESTNPCESMIEMRPPHQPQRQTLAIRRDGPALDRRRHARSRTTVPQDHRLPRPRQARHRDRTRTPPQPAQPDRPRRPLSPSLCNDHTGTAVTKFYDERDILFTSARTSPTRPQPGARAGNGEPDLLCGLTIYHASSSTGPSPI